MRPPKWVPDELILALDLYFREPTINFMNYNEMTRIKTGVKMRRLLFYVLSLLAAFSSLEAQFGLQIFDTMIPTQNISSALNPQANYWDPTLLLNEKGFFISSEAGRWLRYFDQMPYLMNSVGYKINTQSAMAFQWNYAHLSEDIRTDEQGQSLGTFTSYTTTASLMYAGKINNNNSISVSAKWVYELLAPLGTIQEKGRAELQSLCVDLGYEKTLTLLPLSLGVHLRNIGPAVYFGPLPMHLRLDGTGTLYTDRFIRVDVIGRVSKDLVASWPAMDANGDHYIDESEQAYTDPWYKSIFTSWYDNAIYKGDIDYGTDNLIGGYDRDGNPQGWYDKNGNEFQYGDAVDLFGFASDGSYVGWGEYDEDAYVHSEPRKDVGSKNSGSWSDEIDRIQFDVGMSLSLGKYINLLLMYNDESTYYFSNRQLTSLRIGPRWINYTYSVAKWDTGYGYLKNVPFHSFGLTVDSELISMFRAK